MPRQTKHNIFDWADNEDSGYGNLIGLHMVDFHQPLHAPVQATPDLLPNVWASSTLSFTTDSIYEGFVDHIHYGLTFSSDPLTKDQLAGEAIWQSDLLVIQLPQASGMYVHMLAHDKFNRSPQEEDQVTIFGPFNVDLDPPSGSLIINQGEAETNVALVTLAIAAVDNISGVDEMYLDGDILNGGNVRTWIPFSTIAGVTLTVGDGRKDVRVRFRDVPGNTSLWFSDDIIYGLLRYFFNKSHDLSNDMSVNQRIFSIQVANMTGVTNKMNQGDNHGKLSSA